MYTLTYPGAGEHDYSAAYDTLAGWIRDTSAGKFLRARGYIAVAELHPSGHGWHWHLLLGGGRCPKGQLRALQSSWTRYLWDHHRLPGWEGGPVRHKWTRYHSARVLSSYAAKYITKSFGDGDVEPGRHRYLRSEGLGEPDVTTRLYETWADALSSLLHPGSWSYMFNGFDIGRPFVYVLADPPPS
jgi:hypothetical protein